MYSWGGDTSGWAGSKAYDFGSARARYDHDAKAAGATGPRSYLRKREPDMDLADPKKTIKSDSLDPIILGVDVTGSMSSWPEEIFDRLPLLYQTLAKYRPDAEFSFCAIGDATVDSYPLQVTDFTKDINELEARLKSLGCEGGGGGHITESYELFGHYMLNRCDAPNATSPFLIMFGDETFYDKISPDQVKHFMGDDLQSPLESNEMWKNLMQKFNVYFLQKPYGHGDSGVTKEVKNKWGEALGLQRVIDIPEMERSVDVAMGLISKHWGEYSDFKESFDARHDDSTIKSAVHMSLRYIDDKPPAVSVMPKSKSSKTTKSLLK